MADWNLLQFVDGFSITSGNKKSVYHKGLILNRFNVTKLQNAINQ